MKPITYDNGIAMIGSLMIGVNTTARFVLDGTIARPGLNDGRALAIGFQSEMAEKEALIKALQIIRPAIDRDDLATIIDAALAKAGVE